MTCDLVPHFAWAWTIVDSPPRSKMCCRDNAPRMGFLKPALIESRFFPALQARAQPLLWFCRVHEFAHQHLDVSILPLLHWRHNILGRLVDEDKIQTQLAFRVSTEQ